MELSFTIRRLRGVGLFTCVLLLIELLDEVVFGAREAALPLIRDELNLSYQQIGLLLSVPAIIASLVEPVIFILADVGNRKKLLLGGAVMFGIELLVIALAQDFGVLLIAMILIFPASGAFVNLAQAALVESDPQRHEQQMARWTLAGSVGVVAGPLLLSASLYLAGWRELFAVLAVVTAIIALLATRLQFPQHRTEATPTSFRESFNGAWLALRKISVLRWLALLQFSDLMLDVLLSYLALYLVDVVGISPAKAALAITVWTGVGLVGDVLLIPLLERVKGLTYLRFTITLQLILFPMFLLIPGFIPKLVILGLMGLFNAGTYAILKAQLYGALPGQSGAALALASFAGLIGSLIPLGIGLAAEQWGLGSAIWLLIAGPIVVLIGLPRRGWSNNLAELLEELD